jgi:hypothetical protein
MNKKYLFLIVVLLGITALVAGCARDLSKPSTRLVGHWQSESASNRSDLYFSPIDKNTKIGNLVIDDKDGVFYVQYRVVSEDLDGEKLQWQWIQPGVSPMLLNIRVKKDGLKMTDATRAYNYIDSKTSP